MCKVNLFAHQETMVTRGLHVPQKGDSRDDIEETATSIKGKRDLILSAKGLFAFEDECSLY